MNIKKTVIATAVAVSLAGINTSVQADIVNFSWSGVFTLLNTTGGYVVNQDALAAEQVAYAAGDMNAYHYYGNRTPVTGTMQFDTYTGAGAGSINPFDLWGSGPAVFHDMTMQAIGDGYGGQGSLVLANMLWDFKGNNNMSISVVLDAAGLFNAMISGMQQGQTIDQTTCAVVGSGCVTAASENIKTGLGTVKSPYYTYPMGAIPVATTTYNVTNDGSGIGSGSYTDGTGLHAYTANDSIGGSPMDNGLVVGFNANFDMLSVTLESGGCSTGVCPPPVPVPAAVWLLGSGLFGLLGFARRKKH